ncbi:hypothetical protein EYF80_047474 [Liparis tanakae]|uniref:Uncharacterized protein n=1 Tax=Liparis tanakae TaxID=230148 RepID=A0A4Z2FM93_9TELE|nr:hypothetical protein EYF80_047474 [Liparis tanakae]
MWIRYRMQQTELQPELTLCVYTSTRNRQRHFQHPITATAPLPRRACLWLLASSRRPLWQHHCSARPKQPSYSCGERAAELYFHEIFGRTDSDGESPETGSGAVRSMGSPSALSSLMKSIIQEAVAVTSLLAGQGEPWKKTAGRSNECLMKTELKNHLQWEHLAGCLGLSISASPAEEFPEQSTAELTTEAEAQIPNTGCTIRTLAIHACNAPPCLQVVKRLGKPARRHTGTVGESAPHQFNTICPLP